MRTSAVILAVVATMMGLPRAGVAQVAPNVQPSTRFGVGYVVNAPTMFVGFSGFVVTPRLGGLGLYVDAKFDIDSPRDEPGFIPDLTRNDVEDQLGHQFFREEDTWRSFNVALMRPLTPQFMIYAGAGYADRERYWEYIDDEREMGLEGLYWVHFPEESGSDLNLMGGATFSIGKRLGLQFGLETKPGGGTIGVMYHIR